MDDECAGWQPGRGVLGVCSWIHCGADGNLSSQWLDVKCEKDVGKDLEGPFGHLAD